MKPLILIGGGGHCKSVIEAAESAGHKILGILDLPQMLGKKLLGYDIIGTDDCIMKYNNIADFIITIGNVRNTKARHILADKVIQNGGNLGIIVASTANVSKYATLGAGTVVLHGAMINAGAIVGDNCIINTLANIEHDVIVESFCHISTGVMINGNCNIGHDTFLGSQSVICNGIEIVSGCVIAAGSFVLKPIKKAGVYAGNPAILINEL